jgi:iron complex outermembrane receptor protein
MPLAEAGTRTQLQRLKRDEARTSTKRTLDMRPLIHVTSAGIAGLMLYHTPAPAQTSSESQEAVLEEVTVTAQKRSENLQNVPLAVSAISGPTMEALHVNDLKDVTATVPNVQIQVNAGLTNAASFVVRGIGIVGNPSPYVGTEVATVVDGVVQTVNELGLLDRFDVERIEVLRGPQGTLFGANTTGGAVNIVTRQPTGDFEAYGQVGLGNYHSRNVAAAVNFPIVDGTLAGKIMVANRSRDGFYTNLYNGTDIGHIDSTAARGYLKWTPSDDVNVTLQMDAQKARNGTDVLLNISKPGEIFYRPDTPYAFKLHSDVPDRHNADTWGGTLTANWKSGAGDFTSITNYADWKTIGYQDIDGIDLYGYAQVGDTEGWQLSQELRDVIHPTDSVEVLFGLFAQKWHYDSNGQGWVAFVDPGFIDVTLAEQDVTNLAAFSQLYWDLTDRLRFQIGLRASREKVQMDRSNIAYSQPAGTDPLKGFGNLVGAIRLPDNPDNPPAHGNKTWTNFGGKIGLDYKLTDTTMTYGYYARGFKSGGFNGRISRADDIGPFNPEHVDSFELGVKTDLLERRLRLNVAAFYNLWNDMQVTDVFFDGPVQHSQIVNAAKAKTRGLEVEGTMIVTDRFRIDATAGYLKANYTDFTIGNGTLVYDGRDLPYAPKFNGSLTSSYSFPLAQGEATALLQVTHNGKRWGNFTQASSELMKSNTLLNANLSWSPSGQKWTLALWGRNILDKKYTSLALDAPPLFTEGLLGAPREYGMDVKFNF